MLRLVTCVASVIYDPQWNNENSLANSNGILNNLPKTLYIFKYFHKIQILWLTMGRSLVCDEHTHLTDALFTFFVMSSW